LNKNKEAYEGIDFKVNAEKFAPIKNPNINESHINAMNHTLNSKGINLTEAIASTSID